MKTHMNLNEEYFTRALGALGVAITGGFGIRLLDKLLSSGDRRLDEQTQIRKELREEAAALRKELREARDEYKGLFDKYEKLAESYAALLGNFQGLETKYRDLSSDYDSLAKEMAEAKQARDKRPN